MYEELLGKIKELSDDELNNLRMCISREIPLRDLKKEYASRKRNDIFLSILEWNSSDDEMFSHKKVITGEVSFLVEVGTMDKYNRESIDIRGVLIPEYYDAFEHDKQQKSWIHSLGEKKLNKFIERNKAYILQQALKSDIDWFCVQVDHDDPIIGSFELTVYAIQDRVSLRKLMKIKKFSLISSIGEFTPDMMCTANKNGVYYVNGEIAVKKRIWDNKSYFFYIYSA